MEHRLRIEEGQIIPLFEQPIKPQFLLPSIVYGLSFIFHGLRGHIVAIAHDSMESGHCGALGCGKMNLQNGFKPLGETQVLGEPKDWKQFPLTLQLQFGLSDPFVEGMYRKRSYLDKLQAEFSFAGQIFNLQCGGRSSFVPNPTEQELENFLMKQKERSQADENRRVIHIRAGRTLINDIFDDGDRGDAIVLPSNSLQNAETTFRLYKFKGFK